MGGGTSRATLQPAPVGQLLLVGGVAVVALLLVGERYGFHRDELYFLEAGQHLALGYVDQPPLVPALARLQSALLGTSPLVLRVVPALATAATVVLAGALARELGGDRRAQLWTGAAVGGAVFVLTVGHLLSTATFDFVFWLALLVIAARLLRTGEARLWVVYGLVAGVALWNKQLPVLASVALVVALAAGRRWQLLTPRWLLAGGALALVVAAPTLVWQATNGWPQLAMASALSDRVGAESRATLLPAQLILLGPLLVPMAVAGVRRLLRDPDRTFVPLLHAYVVAIVLTFLAGGRPYYVLPFAVVPVAAGAVAWSASGVRSARVTALLGVHVLTSALLALPLLPVAVLVRTPVPDLNDTLVETVGWRRLTDQVAAVVADLPPEERDGVVLLTGSYGEAGALDRYGPARGLPEAYSGHNAYADWRRPEDDDATVVGVRIGLDEHFRSCDLVDRVRFTPAVGNEVEGAPIVVCRGLRGTWSEVWPLLRHLD